MRQAALIQLAAEIPPAMLAGILGIHPTTAVKWTRLAGETGPTTLPPTPVAHSRSVQAGPSDRSSHYCHDAAP
jgi:hypothetical protein